jgi:DNA-binding NtrC family response regulator
LAARHSMSARVLQVAYYPSLLEARRLMLEHDGYAVVSALGNDQAMALAGLDQFDVFVVGSSSDKPVRQKMVRWLKQNVPGTPVVVLLAHIGERFPEADRETLSEDPLVWLAVVAASVIRPC